MICDQTELNLADTAALGSDREVNRSIVAGTSRPKKGAGRAVNRYMRLCHTVLLTIT